MTMEKNVKKKKKDEKKEKKPEEEYFFQSSHTPVFPPSPLSSLVDVSTPLKSYLLVLQSME